MASRPDFNMLITLEAVLTEGSVAGAARRMRLSPSAMSRAVARLRKAMGDPLFVRAGRGLVPTPRALELRDRVGDLVRDAEAVLRPAEKLDLRNLVRTFTLRTSDGFVENFGPRLIARISEEAPGVRLWFVQKTDRTSSPLREASVDLETGVVTESMAPELRAQGLFRDRLVGVVRRGHPLARGRMTLRRYTAGRHVHVSRLGGDQGLIDELLKPVGERRKIVTIVGGFAAAIAIARGSDLIATVPDRHTAALTEGMHRFALPFAAPQVTVSMLWHPRLDADPAHRWLRMCVREICAVQRG